MTTQNVDAIGWWVLIGEHVHDDSVKYMRTYFGALPVVQALFFSAIADGAGYDWSETELGDLITIAAVYCGSSCPSVFIGPNVGGENTAEPLPSVYGGYDSSGDDSTDEYGDEYEETPEAPPTPDHAELIKGLYQVNE